MRELLIHSNAPLDGTPEELSEYLDEACAGDAKLRARVEDLIVADRGAGEHDFMDATPFEKAGDQALESEGVGSIIGNYKLLQEIGEGGFGVVYMADQLAPVKRRVALKIIKLGMDTRQVVARFEVERQALAMMDHPNIAQVHDAGATEAGRPFFVMELVRGIPITEFCREQHLDTNARLVLFIDVCRAIQHAHQKGIIHRDLKPSNVIVTLHDDRAVPKVIDFGIAKATQQDLTDKTLFTRFESFIGTPAYMSPEQAQMSGLDVDTRSDIYALGVLLYELLTGTTPHDARSLAAASQEEIRRVIRDVEPPKPSTRQTERGKRSAGPHELEMPSHAIDSELDWIVMKALEKDRTRRYETANGFAADLKRHLDGEPVEAGPPGFSYRFRKLLRRHQAAVITASAMVVLLMGGVAASTWQWFRARANAVEATEQRDLAQIEGRRAEEGERRAEDGERKANHRVAEELFAANKPQLGIAHLAHLLREDPTNHVAGERLMSALRQPINLIGVSPPLPAIALESLSSSGTYVVGSTADRLGVHVYNVHSGEVVSAKIPLPKGKEVLLAALFSPDEKYLLIASKANRAGSDRGHAQVWDWRLNKKVGLPSIHRAALAYGEISPDGSFIVVTDWGGFVRVWETNGDWRLDVQKEVHAGDPIRALDISPDGRLVVTGDHEGSVQVWEAKTGKDIGPLLVHESALIKTIFDPGGRLVVTGTIDGVARVWDYRTGALKGREMRHKDAITWVDLSPDGEVVLTASLDGTARLWDAATGDPLGEPMAHLNPVLRALFSSNGRMVITQTKRASRLWSVSQPSAVGGELPSGWATFDKEGSRVLINRIGGSSNFWDVRADQPLSQKFRMTWDPPAYRAGSSKSVFTARFSPDAERVITTSTDGSSSVWNVNLRRPPIRLSHRGTPIQSSFNGDGTLVVTSSGSETLVWKPLPGISPRRLVNYRTNAIFCPVKDSQERWRVATASTGESAAVQIWDSLTGEQIGGDLSLAPGIGFATPGYHSSLTFSSDGKRIAALTGANSAKVWDVSGDPESWKLLCELKGILDKAGRLVSPLALGFNPEGTRILTASSDGTTHVWDVQTGQQLGPSLKQAGQATNASFSPDGRFVVTASSDGAQVWNAANGRRQGSALSHSLGVNAVAFSPDSQRVVTGSSDGTARVWDVETGFPCSELLRHDGKINDVSFSSDGNKVLTASADYTARLWDVPPAPRQATPQWVARWAEALAGLRVNAEGAVVALDWDETQKREKEARSHADDDDFYGKTVRWYYEVPSQRAITPFSQFTVDDYIRNRLTEREADGSLRRESLEEVLRIAPNNIDALARFARLLLESENSDKANDLRSARHYLNLALEENPDRDDYHALLKDIDQAKARQGMQSRNDLLEVIVDDVSSLGGKEGAERLLVTVALERIRRTVQRGWPTKLQRTTVMETWKRFVEAEHPALQLIPKGAPWAFNDGRNPLPPVAWKKASFDDSEWRRGSSRLGFGDDGEITLIAKGTESAGRMTFYFRHKFNLDASKVDLSNSLLDLGILRDDGAVVYLNGQEVVRSNMPFGDIESDSPAARTVSGSDEDTFFRHHLNPATLRDGENVIVVEVHQIQPASSDVGFDLELALRIDTGRELGRLITPLLGPEDTLLKFYFSENKDVDLDVASSEDLEVRARTQWVLEQRGDYLSCLEALIDRLTGSYRPVDVRVRKEWQRKKMRVLLEEGRSKDAYAVEQEIRAASLRNPEMDAKQIDLTSVYTDGLFLPDSPLPGGDMDLFERLPESIEAEFEQAFDSRGRIQLNSGRMSAPDLPPLDYNALRNSKRPMQVEIPVNQSCVAIHFLHSCHYGREEPGVVVARYVIHFEDGSKEDVPVIYGEDMADCWVHKCSPEVMAGVKNLVWKKEFNQGSGTGTLGLTQQTWRNERHPDMRISHIEFVSTGAQAAPYLMAMTLE